jgi:tetratricopeptide (TPR) repeat protein
MQRDAQEGSSRHFPNASSGVRVNDQPLMEAFALLGECDEVLDKYEQTRDPALLPAMRAIKPRCEAAIETWSSMLDALPEGVLDPSRQQLQQPGEPARQVLLGSLSMMYLKLGCAHLYLGESDDAKSCFERARDTGIETGRASEVAQAANNLGLIAIEQGDMTGAARYFRWAINRLDPETERDFGPTLRQNLAYVEGQTP